MKIIDPSGKSKQGLTNFFANRLYNSQPALEYFESLNARPELKDALMSGVDNPLNFKAKDVTFVNPFYGRAEEGVKHFKDMGLSDADALKYANADAIKMGYSDAGTTGRLLWENIKAHPFKSAGIGLGTATNVAGLFDNDKIGGQLVGGGLGALAGVKLLPMLMGGPATIPNVALAALGGGTLGSLFDKLRAKKDEEEAAMAAAYAGQY